MQRWVVICWALLALVGADECPDGGRCEEGQTCCKNPASGYGCCPLDQAECCEDHIHCCPAGTLCNTATSSCDNATVSIPWVERASANQPTVSKSFRMIKSYVGEDDDNICPDLSRCPAEFSCLRALTRFGCCPLAQGVPCSDGKHCCPEGHRCSIDCRSCIKKETVSTVLCNDGVSECPDDTTCCETPEGKWGCCPMPKAVCCDDKTHCCPEGTSCDIAHMKCISPTTKKVMPMWAKFPARIRADWENKKDGEKVTAKEVGDTQKEKIPEVTTANEVPQKEEKVSESSVAKADAVNDVPCNDTAACSDGTTCCKTKEGGWACCPLPEAVCCKDMVHCCPKGKKCNLAEQTCEDSKCSVPWLEKVPIIPRKNVQVQVKDVPCDDTAACADGTTCCKTQEGGWACCPLPEAVCCEDFIHCCPKGKKCNLAAQTCEDGLTSLPWLKKIPSIPKKNIQVQVKDVPCDDTTGCADGTTCCKTQEGGWACCPLPEAVCCEDFIHCCPKGKKCNLAAQTCEDGLTSLPWLEKIPSIPKKKVQVQVKEVKCDDTKSCPDGATCCKTQEGTWACCPLPEAVCCDDHEHCCPSGTTCDLATLTCNGVSSSTPMKQKIPAFSATILQVETTTDSQVTSTTETDDGGAMTTQEEKENTKVEAMIKCDAHTSCPRHTTCCFMASTKKWGCCPLPEAVCCKDGTHCCPTNYKCEERRTSCIKDEVVIPWYTKIPATTSAEAHSSFVDCDGVNRCPEDTTCCRLFTGEFGCCPLKNAVCCPDKEHCCPQGYTCDIASMSCHKLIMLQLETVPLTPVYLPQPESLPPINQRDVKCDDQHSCKDEETCCRTSSTTWGCCPSPNAVCCSDMEHCCPTGYTCTDTGSCTQNSGLHWYNWHVFLANKKKALIL